jgi:EAL domain-containing protein (putative c-di-GMP-specific phosphodiesterase class I)
VMAVNMSAVQFKRGNIKDLVLRSLDNSGLDPQFLEIELTESMLLHDMDDMLTLLNELKDMGLKLAIDDFGTGYSSLAYLKKFKIDRLKIDQSFVRDIATDPNDAAIVHAIVQMAHTLNLQVIAEGVENEEMLQYVSSCQCDQAQGYHFARPMPPEAFSAFIADWAQG